MTPPLIALDRVVSVEPGRGAVALRNVPQTLAIFDTHFPLRPVLPGVLVLGSIGVLAGLLLAEQTGRSWRLAGAERVRYRHFVRPGDQLRIAVRLKELRDGEAVLTADVTVDGRTVTSARTIMMVPDLGQERVPT
jgi:3-hydroxyacyl-[acyl-carrier-protein] dehydratase